LLLILSLFILIAWLVLGTAPGRFWLIEREAPPPDIADWPSIAVVIPARDEANLIADTLGSLWRQNYPGSVRVIVVDDGSTDGTSDAAIQAARDLGRLDDLTVLRGANPPAGWTGKVWAMHQGVEQALASGGVEFVLFSDADICHGQETLSELVRRAVTGPYDLVSLMVKLRCDSPAEKLMMPAFVFFFRMLYPFRRVRNVKDRLAGAAGGTMLVRREALERIGGLTSIRNELIDDCALARAIKRGGHPIWLGLSDTSRSTRGFGALGEIVRMISRTAYTQLGYSPARLLVCVVGLLFLFAGPPCLTIGATGKASLIGGMTWVLMAALYVPMLHFYRRSPLWAPLLPLTAVVYLYATIRSAWLHHLSRGGEWKGRVRTME
jgi:hopene-associated glycosyltransferase HpnB